MEMYNTTQHTVYKVNPSNLISQAHRGHVKYTDNAGEERLPIFGTIFDKR